MAILAFDADRVAGGPPTASDPVGEHLIEVSDHAAHTVALIASIQDDRLFERDVPALQSIVDRSRVDAELSLVIRAIVRHGAVRVRRL